MRSPRAVPPASGMPPTQTPKRPLSVECGVVEVRASAVDRAAAGMLVRSADDEIAAGVTVHVIDRRDRLTEEAVGGHADGLDGVEPQAGEAREDMDPPGVHGGAEGVLA